MTDQLSVRDVRDVARVMGLELPLFPSQSHLICIGCGLPITGHANDDDAGWLCDECEEACHD
jgi:hypothetical protein